MTRPIDGPYPVEVEAVLRGITISFELEKDQRDDLVFLLKHYTENMRAKAELEPNLATALLANVALQEELLAVVDVDGLTFEIDLLLAGHLESMISINETKATKAHRRMTPRRLRLLEVVEIVGREARAATHRADSEEAAGG